MIFERSKNRGKGDRHDVLEREGMIEKGEKNRTTSGEEIRRGRGREKRSPRTYSQAGCKKGENCSRAPKRGRERLLLGRRKGHCISNPR